MKLRDSEILQLKNLLQLLNNQSSLTAQKKEMKIITAEDWIKKDLELNKNNLSNSSLRSIKSSFHYFILFFGNIFLNEITKEQVSEFRSYLFGKVKNLVYWRTIRSSLNRAVEYGYLEVNHFNIIKPIKNQQKTFKYISRIELEKTFPFLSRTIHDLVLFTYLTGLRLSEVVFLTWNDVDLREHSLTIGSDSFQTKTRNTRTIPLPNEASLIVQNRIPKIINVNEKNYVFTKPDGKSFTKDYISKQFKKAVRKAGLNEHFTFHSLRHSACTNLIKSGAALPVVQKILGHSNISTTMIYTHINLVDMRKAIDKLFDDQQKIKEN